MNMANVNTANINTATAATTASAVYKVELYNKQQPSTDHNLVRFITRLTDAAKKRGETEKPTECVILPRLQYAEIAGPLQSYLFNMLEDLRASYLRTLWEEGKREFTVADWDYKTLRAFYQERATSSRLTKESINEWTLLHLSHLFPGASQAEQLAKQATLISVLERLAGTVPAINSKNASLALAIIARVPPELGGSVQQAMARKLDAILNPKLDAADILASL